ncbi:uncharacterized protein TrAtP1_001318 [Trichoderma atroviride]|uniref:Phytocyanin domain-containing protein n=1 Tax=Hypocrea atroviridis (strain ATCC 20476 / IMI 206040) TaxID=452589 RepID=G9P202_HYPAI|nr:uncharacterized protein TRIATDRAFT_130800 [Trichoderma atroviride IMI 206040]EHK43428.1 hypothetical protein TRIATDRAFT_130800 [Trichoderma atroviride IMI 206040]UKZ60031.1 hypothetical protein TrAtP1_001318 [Trichoderma atroviride]
MPSVKSLLSAAALACLASGETIKITATSSNTFDPSTITASHGDILEFHFEPKNHSVVSGLYAFPCTPMQLGTGFFSGFSFNTTDGEADKVFRVTVNGTEPTPFYSSQGNECSGGMVGIINPSKNQTLADFKKRASALARSVSPGRTSFGGEIADNDDDSSNSTSSGNGSSGGKGGSSGGSSGSGSDKDGKDNGSVSLSVSIGALALAMLMAI